MICKYCSTENPDNAVYCLECGKRIDGKIVCPICSTANEERAKFCLACGSRIDGKRTCPGCGEVLPEGARFCPACGHSPDAFPRPAQRETAAASPSPKRAASPRSASFYLSLSGGIVLLASAAIAFIFMFLLGLTSKTVELGETSRASISVYDFFSSAYDDIAVALKAFSGDTGILAFSLYFNAAFGTLVGAGCFVSIPICLAVAIVRFVRHVRGTRGNTDFFTPAAAAYGVFLCGACILLSLYAQDVTGTERTVHTSLNGATLAGLILGGIFFGAGCGLQFAAKGKSAMNRMSAIKGIFAILCSILSVIILAFAAKGSIGMRSEGSVNIMSLLSISAMRFIGTEYSAAPTDQLTTAMLAEVFGIGIILLCAYLLLNSWGKLLTEEDRSQRSDVPFVAGVLLVCAIAALATNMVFGKLFLNYIYPEDDTYMLTQRPTMTYTAPIVMLVFAALLFAAAVVYAVLLYHERKKQAGAMEPLGEGVQLDEETEDEGTMSEEE